MHQQQMDPSSESGNPPWDKFFLQPFPFFFGLLSQGEIDRTRKEHQESASRFVGWSEVLGQQKTKQSDDKVDCEDKILL